MRSKESKRARRAEGVGGRVINDYIEMHPRFRIFPKIVFGYINADLRLQHHYQRFFAIYTLILMFQNVIISYR